MAEGAPKAPVVAEAHEVDTFRESFENLCRLSDELRSDTGLGHSGTTPLVKDTIANARVA